MKKAAILFVFFVYLFSFSIFLFSQAATSKIIGTVTDQEGLPIPGVSVVGTSPKLVGQATATTDIKGTYRLLGLQSGKYTLTFSLFRFKVYKQENINLLPEQTLSVDVNMQLGLEEEITVVAEAPLIDVRSAAQGMTLDQDVLSTLPRGRSFESLVTIIAGAAHEDRAGGIAIDGATGLENMFYVDGMETTDPLRGRRFQDAAFEFIDEVQVKSSGYNAEFGGSLGGVVNVITRSGGNEFHGEVFGYYSGSALTGKERDDLRLNPFDITKAEYVNYQDMYGKDKVHNYEVGFSLGGYIIKDRVWFFGSFLPKFQDTTRQINWLTGDIPSSSHEEKREWYNFMGKISSQALKNLRLNATVVNNFSTYTGQLPSRDGTDDSSFPYEKVGFDYPNWTVTGSADLTLGNNFMANIRGGYFTYNTRNQKLKPDRPRYSFGRVGSGASQTNAIYPELVDMYPEYIRAAGFQNFGRSELRETKKDMLNRTSINTDLTYYFNLGGEHAIKAGFQWVSLIDDVINTNAYADITFGWGSEYVIVGQEETPYKGEYGVYEVCLVNDTGDYGKASSNRYAFYLQDSWTLANNRVTLNYGLRAEKEEIPVYDSEPRLAGKSLIFNFIDKLAPRFGLVYDVFGDSSLKVFGNFAIYYDVMKLWMARGAYGGKRDIFNIYTLDDPKWWTYGEGYMPGNLVVRYDEWGDPVGMWDLTDKDLKPMSQREISLGAEKRLTTDISVSFRFVRKDLLSTIEDMGVTRVWGSEWYIGNPGEGLMRSISEGGIMPDEMPSPPKPKREYTAVNLVLEKRLSNNWLGGFSYTWSQLRGNYSGLASTERGQFSPNFLALFDRFYTERKKDMTPVDGPLPTDRPHFFKLYGSYIFDFGLSVGFVSSARTGIPVSRQIRIPSRMYIDGLMSDGRMPFLWTTNLYVEYNIKLGKTRLNINLNVDNVFDVKTAGYKYNYMISGRIRPTNDQIVNNTWEVEDFNPAPEPRFLMEYGFYPPIEARLGLRFSF